MEIIDIKSLVTSDIVVLSLLLAMFLIQMYFVLSHYLKLARHKDDPPQQQADQVTIVLSVRNEEGQIESIVDKFSQFESDDYQILVVNSCSEDNTGGVLKAMAENNRRLKVTTLTQETRFSEKQAINIGLKGASSPMVILMSPMVSEIKPGWLTGMSGLLDSETDLVVAYTNAERIKGMRNLICRLERFDQFMVGAAWTLADKPFVFNENNVLFRKSMYFETLGFRHKLNRNFANLELIFNENLKKGRVKITTDPNLAVREHIEDDRGDHVRLLKKNVQIKQSLPWSLKISLLVDSLSRILMPVFLAIAIVMLPMYWASIAALPLLYLIVLAVSVKLLLNRLQERRIFILSFLYFLIKPIINGWFFWSMHIIHRRNKWN